MELNEIGKRAKAAAHRLAIMPTVKKNEALNLFNDIELPLCNVLAKMEIEGFPLNVETLRSLGVQFKEKLNDITKKIYLEAEEEFNIAIPRNFEIIGHANTEDDLRNRFINIPYWHHENCENDKIKDKNIKLFFNF